MGQKPSAVPAAHSSIDDLDILQHELGNVVHGVACVTGLLRESELNGQQRRWLATIDRACGQIHGILDHARRARSNPAGLPCAARLNGVSLLEDTLLTHAPAAAGKGLDLLLRVSPRLPAYWSGDPCLLRQLLDNLVGNAVRYASEGPVVVEAARQRGTRDTLILRVLDSGPGVEEAERLFDLRWRGIAGRDGPCGSGLGLYISRCIAETLGGAIRCRNRRAGGACFEVSLPATVQGSDSDWPPLDAFSGLECRLDLEREWLRCVGAALERLGVRWRVGEHGSGPLPKNRLACVIRRPGPAWRPVGGLLVHAERPGRANRPLHVPGPVLESSLERVLYRLLLDARLDVNPGAARG
jgi:hypothetical protein